MLQRIGAYQKGVLAVIGVMSLLVASTVLVFPSVSSAASQGTIKIGLITSLSGPEASTFANVPEGAQARIDAQNANGGVHGEHLQLITEDDQGSPAGALTAAKSLVSQGVSVILTQDLFFFAAAPYVQQHGIPVIGAAQDGTEWANPKNRNMFGVFGVPAPGYPTTTSWGKYFKSHGATKLGLLAYGESPASVAAAKGVAISAKKAGVQVAYENLSLPIATTDFGPIALAMKNAGVNAFYGGILTSSELALLTALQQSNVTLKVPMLVGGISQSLLETPGLSSVQNLQVISQYAPVELNTPATKKFQSTMQKYVNFFQVPDIFVEGTYIAADMAIKGLQLAGPNASNAKYITTLRKVTNYNGAGLYPAPLNLSKQSGTNDVAGSGPAFCWYVLKIVNAKASMQQKSPVCGVPIPNSDTAAPTT